MTKLMKSPLRYPGGKSRAIKHILPQIPGRIQEYREPFVGGGSVYLAIRSTFKSFVPAYWINDLNFDLYCFWKYARDDLNQLTTCIWEFKHNYPDGRELYTFLKNDENMPTDFDRAVRFFVMNRITFSGVTDAGGYSEQSFEKRFTDSSIKRLEGLSGYLSSTRITSQDYESMLFENGDSVFIFLDPPYLSAAESRLYGVRGSLHTSFDHERFAEN
ncbi:MAG TPA: DNA adenine methylase, partial [Aggregatilineales bacterium]|nr:DNA adenine methylase [Aggregatilineales bacterium]